MSDTSTVIPLITPAYTLTGPASLSVGSKAIFSVTPTAGTTLSAPLVVTPTCTLSGTFTPATVTLPVGSTSTVTFTFTPTEAGSGTLSTTNSAGLTDSHRSFRLLDRSLQYLHTYTLTGASSLTAGVASTYTITPGAGSASTQAITITPLCTLAGTFSPAVISLPAGSTSAVTFTFTPTASGVGTLSTNSNGALTDPGDLFITVASTQAPFTQYSLAGPQALTVGSAATYTITPGSGTANTKAVTVVPSCTLAGTFSPQTSTIPAGSTAPLTFTFTPSVAGTGNFTVTNSAALSNPAAFTVTAMAFSAAYTLTVDSSAFLFSPGNWTGDEGRDGALWRSTWNPGAWFQ
uniref:GPI-anchored protein PB15E9.01c n=1 Tax=Drosophila rhopaloa TaxID=1041015 RepID=A0A6P4FC03_DRORH